MTIASSRRSLIIGGGIAGTVVAMALRAAGLEVVVFEAYERTAHGVGAFLTLAVNGIGALGAIDVDVSRLGFATPRMVISLGNGHPLAEFPSGPAPGSRTVKRSDLYDALRAEAVRRGVEVVYGKRLADATTTPAGTVVARFGDGTEAEGDLLVGADGLWSRTRAIVDPEAPPPRYLGLLNTGGFARGVAVAGEPGTMHMIFGRRCFFCYVPHPSGEVWWFANPNRAREPTREELAAITAEAWRAELIELFRADASPAVELVGASDAIFAPWPTHDLPNLPTWHRGRAIVIGDAAHAASPSSGQGASMAIEDAIVLARCVRDELTVEAAFTAFERRRRARVERVVALGKRNGTGKTPGPLGRVARDLALRLVFPRLAAKGAAATAWLYDDAIA